MGVKLCVSPYKVKHRLRRIFRPYRESKRMGNTS